MKSNNPIQIQVCWFWSWFCWSWSIFVTFGVRRFYPEVGRKKAEVGRKKPEVRRIFFWYFFSNFEVGMLKTNTGTLVEHMDTLEFVWIHFIDFGLMSLNSQPSRSLSSSTLLRGADLLRSATMSIESDPQMMEMQKELEKLKVPSHWKKAMDFWILVLWPHNSVRGFSILRALFCN